MEFVQVNLTTPYLFFIVPSTRVFPNPEKRNFYTKSLIGYLIIPIIPNPPIIPITPITAHHTKKRRHPLDVVFSALFALSCFRGLNSGPLPYQGSALPLS